MLANFFFATSALVELPTFATFFPGFNKPASFVDPRGFGPWPLWVLTSLPLSLFSSSFWVVRVAKVKDQRCRGLSPHPEHAFQHLAMQDVANETSIDIANDQTQYYTQDLLCGRKQKNETISYIKCKEA